jgi:hypothetical protein
MANVSGGDVDCCTLDRRDFRDLIGQKVYGLRVLTPGEFLRSQLQSR